MLKGLLRGTFYINTEEFLKSLSKVCAESFPIILIFSFAIGLSLGFEFILAMRTVGAQDMAPYFTTLAILREIGPMVAGSQILVRSGTRITAELASAKDRQIITALEVIPVDPFAYLFAPRFWAICIASTLFSPIATVVSILASAFFIVWLSGVSLGAFWEGVRMAGTLDDVLIGLFKCFLIGISNSYFCISSAIYSPEGARGVSQALAKAVGKSTVIAITINYLLSFIFYGY